MARFLVVDDDSKICLFFTELIKEMGHLASVAGNLQDALKLAFNNHYDLILLDLELPDGNALHILPDLMKAPSEPEVIIITGTGDIRGAELAFKYGAWDYVQKPFLLTEVSLPITRALQYRKEKQTKISPVPLVRPGIVGESDAICRCLKDVARAAVTDASVLITGETGTGKELFARAIHENSRRSSKNFIAVDCGALPDTLVESTLFGHAKGAFTGAQKSQDGLIKQADGGTLLLDEVGDLPMAVQKSFLRTLQEKKIRPLGGKSEVPIDFRLVAATNLDLDKMVEEKRFREDLLYRIRAIGIKLPPLKDREKDIQEITVKKIHELAQRYNMETKGISPEFFETLNTHDWPGNVRELINVLEYALASAGQDPTLIPKHLPPEYRTGKLHFDSTAATKENKQYIQFPDTNGRFPSLYDYRFKNEKHYLKMLLDEVKGDRRRAAELSEISQSSLYGLLKKHNLSN